MNIQTIKEKKGCYLVNDSISVPKDPQNSDYQKIQKWLESGNSIDLEFKKSNLKESLTELIKLQAAKRIVDAYPEWKQANYIAAVTGIHNKEIVAMKADPFVGQYQLTAEELQTLKDADTCKKFITGIRTKSNRLETSLDAMTSAELEAFDPTKDSHWQ